MLRLENEIRQAEKEVQRLQQIFWQRTDTDSPRQSTDTVEPNMSNDSDYSPDPKLQPLELNVSHRQIASGSDRPCDYAIDSTSRVSTRSWSTRQLRKLSQRLPSLWISCRRRIWDGSFTRWPWIQPEHPTRRYCFSPQRSGTRKHRITSIVAHDGCKSRRNALWYWKWGYCEILHGRYPRGSDMAQLFPSNF